MRGLGDHASKRISQKAAAPELQPRSRRAIPEHIAMLHAHAIHPGHINPVGDGVRPLDSLPRLILRRAKFLFLRRVPADGGGIKKHLGPLQSGQPRGLGIPLIPANQCTHAPKDRIHGLKTKVARRKIVFLVVERIVRNMHLSVNPGNRSIGVQSNRRVVIKPRRAPFKKRSDDGDLRFPRNLGQSRCGRTGNLLRKVKERKLLALAKVLRLKKLRQTHDIRAQLRRLANVFDRRSEVRLRVHSHAHLYEPDGVFACIPHSSRQSSQTMQQGQLHRAELAS